MRSLEQRERALNMYFHERKSSGEIAKILSLPRNTIKSWVHRYEMQHGNVQRTKQYKGQLIRQREKEIKVTHSYKPRVKSVGQTAKERIAQLEMEVDLLRNFLLTEKKKVDRRIIFSLIDRYAKKYAVLRMCAFYGVSRSGYYYAWKKRDPVSCADAELVKLIEECQDRHKRRYGYRRVKLWLKREKQITVNHKRGLRVMSQYGLLSVIRRRRLHRYKQNGNLIYVNLLNRDFHADAPNMKWVTDISYIVTPGGTLYLSAIRDLYDQSIVAFRMARRQDYSLVGRTINAALNSEHPRNKLILHSDQGGQYRSFEYQADAMRNGLTPSMSAPGAPGDNAMAENLFSILKTECIYLKKPETPEIAESSQAIFSITI